MAEQTIRLTARYASELEMTQLAAQGDRVAQRDLIKSLFNHVRRTISYLTQPQRDAEDLAQLALIQILNSAGAFRGQCALKYWADRIAVRTAMKHFRKRQRREKLNEFHGEPHFPEESQLDDDIALRQIRVRLAELLQKLSPDRRAALVLHHVHGYDVTEIAEMTDTPLNTVRDRLRIGRRQLRKKILADPLLRDWVIVGAK